MPVDHRGRLARRAEPLGVDNGMAACLVLAPVMASTDARAGAKDESAAEWLAPKRFNEWHDGLANKGLNFGAKLFVLGVELADFGFD